MQKRQKISGAEYSKRIITGCIACALVQMLEFYHGYTRR